FFNDGVIAQAAEKAVTNGVFYASAAGNDGNNGWQDSWRGVKNTTVGSVKGTFDNLSASGTADFLQDFTLAKGDELDLTVQWDDAYLEGGGGTGNFAVQTDLAVHVTDPTGTTIYQTFDDDNANTGE